MNSEVGKGTTFRVILPALAHVGASNRASSDVQNAKSGSETVLLVEDDAALRRLARIMLVSYGYKVLDAANGAEALQLFAEHASSIELLVTDIVMPGMSGLDLADQVIARKPEIRVLLTSGYVADHETRNRFLGPEFSFLPKPFTVLSLALKVRSVLDG